MTIVFSLIIHGCTYGHCLPEIATGVKLKTLYNNNAQTKHWSMVILPQPQKQPHTQYTGHLEKMLIE